MEDTTPTPGQAEVGQISMVVDQVMALLGPELADLRAGRRADAQQLKELRREVAQLREMVAANSLANNPFSDRPKLGAGKLKQTVKHIRMGAILGGVTGGSASAKQKRAAGRIYDCPVFDETPATSTQQDHPKRITTAAEPSPRVLQGVQSPAAPVTHWDTARKKIAVLGRVAASVRTTRLRAHASTSAFTESPGSPKPGTGGASSPSAPADVFPQGGVELARNEDEGPMADEDPPEISDGHREAVLAVARGECSQSQGGGIVNNLQGPEGNVTDKAFAKSLLFRRTASEDGDLVSKSKITANDEASAERWIQHTQNAYGAFAHVSMQSGLLRAIQMCGPMLMVSVVIQAVFSSQLIHYHRNDLSDLGEQICNVPVLLQCSASVIFLTLMFNEVPSMIQSLRLVLFASHHYGGDGDTVGEIDHEDTVSVQRITMSFPSRLVVCTCAVLTEIGTWCAILAAGCMWINTSPTGKGRVRRCKGVYCSACMCGHRLTQGERQWTSFFGQRSPSCSRKTSTN